MWYILGTHAVCSRRVRMGRVGDGGWDVCEDPQHILNPASCLVYSFGIAHDPSFDTAIQKYGCEVHSFDPSLGKYDPSSGQRFHFHKIGIGAKNIEGSVGEWTLQTLGKIRESFNHTPSKRRLDVVKMDVEGAELETLMTALDEGSLQDVGQLVFEIHLMSSAAKNGYVLVKDNLLSFLKLLRRLWQEGFRLFHTNRNTAPVNVYTNADEGKQRTHCYELYMVRVQPHTGSN